MADSARAGGQVDNAVEFVIQGITLDGRIAERSKLAELQRVGDTA